LHGVKPVRALASIPLARYIVGEKCRKLGFSAVAIKVSSFDTARIDAVTD